MKDHFENLSSNNIDDTDIDDLYLVNYIATYWIDHEKNLSYWVYSDDDFIDIYKSVEKELSDGIKIKTKNFSVLEDIQYNFSTQGHKKLIKKTLQYISEGDIFQANITARFCGSYLDRKSVV